MTTRRLLIICNPNFFWMWWHAAGTCFIIAVLPHFKFYMALMMLVLFPKAVKSGVTGNDVHS